MKSSNVVPINKNVNESPLTLAQLDKICDGLLMQKAENNPKLLAEMSKQLNAINWMTKRANEAG